MTLVSVLPFMLISKNPKKYFRTTILKIHLIRAMLGAIAIGSVTYSICKLTLLQTTCILFFEPLIYLLIARFFLNEQIDKGKWIATIIGFTGILVVTSPELKSANVIIIFPLIGATCWAITSVYIKKTVSVKEHLSTRLFYFALGTTLLFLYPAILVWKPLTIYNVCTLCVIGLLGNLIQCFIFIACSMVPISSLMPIRYSEWIFTCIFGILLFGQIPVLTTLVGSVFIISGSVLASYFENKKAKILAES